MRDTQLDCYRALAMIYIVSVIHVVYWLGHITVPYTSLLLIEMPVIFFIAGASAALSGKKSSWRELLKNRVKRVVLPYYIYAGVCLTFLCIVSFVPPLRPLTNCPITDYDFTSWCFVALCQSIRGVPYVLHLWFIIPYMLIAVLFIFQERWVKKLGAWYIVGNFVALWLLEHLLPTADKASYISLLRSNLFYVVAYNIFFVCGFLYYKRLRFRTLLLASGGLFAAFLFVTGGVIPDFQEQKFPPTTLFVLYGLLSLCLLSIIASKLRITYGPLLQLWNRRGYTIYLYQNFNMTFFTLLFIGSRSWLCIRGLFSTPCEIAFSFLVVFVLNTLSSILFTKIESAVAIAIQAFAQTVRRHVATHRVP